MSFPNSQSNVIFFFVRMNMVMTHKKITSQIMCRGYLICIVLLIQVVLVVLVWVVLVVLVILVWVVLVVLKILWVLHYLEYPIKKMKFDFGYDIID